MVFLKLISLNARGLKNIDIAYFQETHLKENEK